MRLLACLVLFAPSFASAFDVPTIPGERRQVGNPSEGLLGVKTAEVSQTVSWAPPQGHLADTVEHEVGLMGKAADQMGAKASVVAGPGLKGVAGTGGVHWAVRADDTLFVGTAWDCPGTRIVLVTMGPDESTINRAHNRSLSGASCDMAVGEKVSDRVLSPGVKKLGKLPPAPEGHKGSLTCVARALIDKRGKVESVEVKPGCPSEQAQIIRTVWGKSKWKPAKVDGSKVPSRSEWTRAKFE